MSRFAAVAFDLDDTLCRHDHDVDALYREAFEAVADESRVAYLPGATEALTAAAAAGPVGVLTNGPEERQRAKVESLGLADRVDAVVYAGDLPRRKPHAEPFERLGAALSVDPREMLYVGNSLAYDVAGAHNAGLRSAWLRPSPDDASDPYRPDYVLDSLDEFAALLAEGCETETGDAGAGDGGDERTATGGEGPE